MLVWLDNKLSWIGKQIVVAADFVGISHRRLVIGWVIWGVIVFLLPNGMLKDYPLGGLLMWSGFLLVGVVIVSTMVLHQVLYNLWWAEHSENALPPIASPESRTTRVLIPLGTIAIALPPFRHTLGAGWQIALILKVLFPYAFWPYLIMHHGMRCKVSLRERVKQAKKAVKQALAPTPRSNPSPSPQPS